MRVLILPYQQWVSELSSDVLVDDEQEEGVEPQSAMFEQSKQLRLITGRVVEVVKQGNREFVCSVSADASSF